jgi:dTDP-4-amino-4,6-dideoxygalactose transaminase
MNIPFVDLKSQYHSIQTEILSAIQDVLENSSFILGPAVGEFENNFAEAIGVKHAIGVNNGTSALHLALLAIGVEPGDEVITTPHTFIATAEAISACGARPVFVDIDPEPFTIDPSKIEKVITPKTKVILPVHLYGQAADLDPIITIATKHKLFVLEDACQAHFAEYKNRKVGGIGDLAAFSFYPGKNLGAYGEGGAVTTLRNEWAENIRSLRDHGSSQKYFHQYIGFNYRLEGIQAAVLNVKLKYIEKWTELRRHHAHTYSEKLKNIDEIKTPREMSYGKHVFHLYVIRAKNRDQLQVFLKEKGISTGLHYPVPVHLQEAYRSLGYREGDFPITETAAHEILSLPLFPELTGEQIDFTVQALKTFYRK